MAFTSADGMRRVPYLVEAMRAAILHVMDPANAAFYAEMAQRAREDVFKRFNEETFRHGLLLHAGMISQEQFERGSGTSAASVGLSIEPRQFQQAG